MLKGFQKGNKINLGKKQSEATKNKMRLVHKGKLYRGYGWHHSEVTKRKMSETQKGKPKTEEAKRKMSEAKKKNPIRYWLGKKRPPFSEEWKRKNSERNRLSNNPNWRDGISFEPYSVDWTKTLKKSIRQRDKYTCQLCGKEPAICVHHIDYDKKNNNPNNLITLCSSCHSKTNFNRKYWTNYFKYEV